MSELEEIDKDIERQMKLVVLHDIRVYDKHQHGNGPRNELKRLKAERDLILTGIDWEHYGSGTVLISKKFIYALNSGKWRNISTKKWYRSKGINHFIENYVRKDQ
tara:strand:- start:234 stop:548 length:315 start_codon:yes stop_codon:yes gene_type:complete